MDWLSRYRMRIFVRNSLWLFPAAGIIAGLITVAFLNRLETDLGLEADVRAENARGILFSTAGSLFSLVVLVTSAVLLAVQLTSAQLTPRIIAIVYRDPFRKAVLTCFAFTFTFSVAVLVRIEDKVPLLTTYLAAYGFLLNLALFLLFIDGMGKALRPSAILSRVAFIGREVIRNVYPRELDEDNVRPPERMKMISEEPERIVINQIDGVVLAFDLDGLITLAETFDCVVELVPEVGDFVAAGDPLFRIFRGGDDLPEEMLIASVAIGVERTTEQDPMFAFRIMVDIASKALSPAINDPTTAVLAIDQIHHLLKEVGKRYLAEGRAYDTHGELRLVYSTPNWEDFVHLASTEIRQYGRDSVQVMRRLRAMVQNLIDSLPRIREPRLAVELELLDSSIRRIFPDVEDQVLAETADFQGLGGSREAHINRVARREQAAARSGV